MRSEGLGARRRESGRGESGVGSGQRHYSRPEAGDSRLRIPDSRRTGRRTILGVVAALAALGLGCSRGEPRIPETRLWTDDLAIRVSSDPVPPRALERVRYKIVVQDKETKQPIETGQGRIFATSRDRKNVDNGLEKGQEPGTYYTTLMFITAGEWAMGIQFRRDSTQRLERTADWMQEVRAATPPGDTAP